MSLFFEDSSLWSSLCEVRNIKAPVLWMWGFSTVPPCPIPLYFLADKELPFPVPLKLCSTTCLALVIVSRGDACQLHLRKSAYELDLTSYVPSSGQARCSGWWNLLQPGFQSECDLRRRPHQSPSHLTWDMASVRQELQLFEVTEIQGCLLLQCNWGFSPSVEIIPGFSPISFFGRAARLVECSFPNVLCSVVSDSAAPWTVACLAPLCMEFSRQEYWSRYPNQGSNLGPQQWKPGVLTTGPTENTLLFLTRWRIKILEYFWIVNPPFILGLKSTLLWCGVLLDLIC